MFSAKNKNLDDLAKESNKTGEIGWSVISGGMIVYFIYSEEYSSALILIFILLLIFQVHILRCRMDSLIHYLKKRSEPDSSGQN